MTRHFLAAGVAALAIAAPAAAGPHGGGPGGGGPHGGGGGPQMEMPHGGGGNPHFGGDGPHGGGGPRFEAPRGGGGPHGGGGPEFRPQVMERMQAPQMRVERQQFRRQQMHVERQQFRPQQMRAERQQFRPQHMERMQARAEHQQAQNQRLDRQQMRMQQAQNRGTEPRDMAAQQLRNRPFTDRPPINDQRIAATGGSFANNGRGYGVGGCPPGLADKGCVPPGLARQDQLDSLRRADPLAFQNSRLQLLTPATRILAPTDAFRYLGAPLSTVNNFVPLAALPQSVSYLYPDTNDYYYRYGDGYLYQVDRSSNLIDSLLPLLGGGYLPGSYLPQNYMSSYVPGNYGLNSFYPASYSDYGGYDDYYGNTCNRYANGVVYQVDCGSGLVRNIVPTYAGGYGVGQMLPSSYDYYNVPMDYRSLYYPTSDRSYWYAPGAIYQTDPSSNLITSVAALLSPGFNVGQPLPAGYGMYNVPMAYRSTYYDTPNAWYRYNNGNIYQVDPTTQLVTAIVASLLT